LIAGPNPTPHLINLAAKTKRIKLGPLGYCSPPGTRSDWRWTSRGRTKSPRGGQSRASRAECSHTG
jgi:hypothetical protein